MTIDEMIVYGKKYCHSDHVKILVAELLGKNPLELLTCLNEEVPLDKIELYKQEIAALKEGKPLQYVIGYVNFFGYKFKVNKNVLIPRFETEQLVETTLKYIENNFQKDVKILDIGCGSGVIGLTLKKKLPKAQVDLLDISKEALDVAKENAKNLDLDVNFIHSDCFANVLDKYDIIISNPPYIGLEEEIDSIVKENEPYIALYAGQEGLDIYKKILREIQNHVKEKYLIAFEIGCNQAPKIIDIVNCYLKNVNLEVKKDLADKDRMLFIFKNNE